MSPLGPMSFVLSQNISKADTDKTESFRFNLGTTLGFMKNIFKFIALFFLLMSLQQSLKAEVYYLDFKTILDQSVAGKKQTKV